MWIRTWPPPFAPLWLWSLPGPSLSRLGSHAGLVHVGRRSWLFLIASGLATGLSWICYFRALSLGEASKVAPIDKLSVVFVVLLAWPLLGETITLPKAAGVLLIAAGAIVLAWA